jgi:hypothetical protein
MQAVCVRSVKRAFQHQHCFLRFVPYLDGHDSLPSSHLPEVILRPLAQAILGASQGGPIGACRVAAEARRHTPTHAELAREGSPATCFTPQPSRGLNEASLTP